MVTAQKHHALGLIQFYRKQQHADLETENAPVYIVSQKQVVEGPRLTGLGDHVEHIRILPMDITHNTDRLINRHQIGLLFEHCHNTLEQLDHLRFRNRPFTCQKILNELPVWNPFLDPEFVISNRPLGQGGTLFILQFPVLARIVQKRTLKAVAESGRLNHDFFLTDLKK